jgi:hypothetical protein
MGGMSVEGLMREKRMRWRFARVVLAVVGIAVTGGALPAFAQQSGATAESTLILGTVASDPGTTATIPLYYKPATAQFVRSVHLEVEFVSNSVKYAKAEKGVAAETQNFDLVVNAKELPPDDKNIQRTRLSIDVTVTDSDAKKSLPEGLWALLDFRVPTGAKAFAIALNPVTLTAQEGDRNPVKLTGEAGKVIVSVPDEPMAGCFFFTH